MSGESTGQILGASTTSAGVALLPATGGSTVLHLLTIVLVAAGVLVFASFTASRIYRAVSN